MAVEAPRPDVWSVDLETSGSGSPVPPGSHPPPKGGFCRPLAEMTPDTAYGRPPSPPNRHEASRPPSAAPPAERGSRMNATRHPLDAHPWREWIMRGFIRVEDAVYVGLGTVLAAMALALLVAVAIAFGQALLADTLPGHAVQLLDRLLLIL